MDAFPPPLGKSIGGLERPPGDNLFDHREDERNEHRHVGGGCNESLQCRNVRFLHGCANLSFASPWASNPTQGQQISMATASAFWADGEQG